MRFEAKKQHGRILPLARATCAKLLLVSGRYTDEDAANARAAKLVGEDDVIINDSKIRPETKTTRVFLFATTMITNSLINEVIH